MLWFHSSGVSGLKSRELQPIASTLVFVPKSLHLLITTDFAPNFRLYTSASADLNHSLATIQIQMFGNLHKTIIVQVKDFGWWLWFFDW